MLLVDKTAGLTSHDVVAHVRRATGERRIGHAGTLDPFATGLLVLLVGRGTRLLPYIDGEPKVYEAEIAFGAERTTDDLTGEITRTAAAPAREAIERGIATLTGTFEQVPPSFSAKKVGGRRSYQAARAGEAMALPPSTVTVHRWEPLQWGEQSLRARITCGGGTYIRALARDLGRAAGSAAHLHSLRRTRSGHFDVAAARGTEDPDFVESLLPLRAAVSSLPAVQLDAEQARRIGSGLRVPAAESGSDRVALLEPGGTLLAVAERAGAEWQPRLVLA